MASAERKITAQPPVLDVNSLVALYAVIFSPGTADLYATNSYYCKFTVSPKLSLSHPNKKRVGDWH